MWKERKTRYSAETFAIASHQSPHATTTCLKNNSDFSAVAL